MSHPHADTCVYADMCVYADGPVCRYVVAKGFKGLSPDVLEKLNAYVDIPQSTNAAATTAVAGAGAGAGADADPALSAAPAGGESIPLISTAFVAAVQGCAEYFSKHMRNAIERNLVTDGKLSHRDKCMLNDIKARVSAHFISRTGLSSIPDHARVVPPARPV